MSESPYIGLQPFTEAERDYFFGRDREQRIIAANLFSANLTILYGDSGVGKSSILAAGVVPKLRAQRHIAIVTFRKWQDENFLTAFKSECLRAIALTRPESANIDLNLPLDDFLLAAAQAFDGKILIILDQFEEYFLYHQEFSFAEDSFEAQFARAVNREDVTATFLLALREDSLSKLDRFRARIPNLMSNTLRLQHLDANAAEQAIRKPLDVYNARHTDAPVTIEDELVQEIIEEIRTGKVSFGQPGSSGATNLKTQARIQAPFLQMVMTRLWDAEMSSQSNALRLATLKNLGGVEAIVRTHLDTVMNKLNAEEQGVCSTFFDRLVTPSGTKIAQTMDDLTDYAKRPVTQVMPILKTLADARILLPIAPPIDQPAVKRYEIFHDVLAPAVLDWRRRFVEKQDRAKERARVRRFQLAALGATILVIVFAALSLFAFQQRDAATHAQATAVVARDLANRQARVARAGQLAAQSQATLAEFPLRSMLLAVEAISVTWQANEPRQASAEEALRATLQNPRGTLLSGHQLPITTLAYSPDGRWLATGSQDQTVRLWRVGVGNSAGDSIILSGHTETISALSFSADNHWLATASQDGTARLWDLRAANPAASPIILKGHASIVDAVAFSPDGHWLATASYDETARLWDLTASPPGSKSIVLRGHLDALLALAFSPDNRWFATASQDATARLWDLRAANPAASSIVLKGHDGLIWTMAFSLDGHWLATGSRDKTARLWDLTSSPPGSTSIVLRGHTDWVNALAFSSDNRWLATGSGDKTVRLWDLSSDPTTHVQVLHGHSSWINAVAFSSDGHWLASGSGDKTARLWNLRAADPAADPVVLSGHDDQVRTLAFNPDGQSIATGSDDHTIRLWLVNPPDPAIDPIVLRGPADQINTLAISPDGQWLASGGGDPSKDEQDKVVRLWNLGNSNPAIAPLLLKGHTSWIQSLAFSPDGRWLATASGDKTARLWDLRAANPAAQSIVLKGHNDFVFALAFSSDGRWLATGSWDKTVRLWDLTAIDPSAKSIVLNAGNDRINMLAFSPNARKLATASGNNIFLWDVSNADPAIRPIQLNGHSNQVAALAFSPDGRWLASGSRDKNVRLWDLQSTDPAAHPLVLSGHTDWVNALSFSFDGHWLATGSRDKTARLWEMRANDPGTQSIVLAGHTDQINTLAFSATARWLATGSDDHTIRLWDMNAASPSADPVTLRGHQGGVTALAFAPNGQHLATGSQDQTVRLWLLQTNDLINLACRNAGRNLTDDEWRLFFSDVSYHKTCEP